MKGLCPYCKNTEPKVGARLGGSFICDDCMNRPERTRPSTNKETEPLVAMIGFTSKPEREEAVVLNQFVIRDEDESGPVVGIPSDGDLKPVSEAEIAKAREEAKNDSRKYVPTNARTLAKIGALVSDVTNEGTTESTAVEKPVAAKRGRRSKAANKGARKSAGGAKRTKTR